MALRSGPRILLVRLSAIGDVMVTTPVSRVLREALPDAHLTWVVEPRAREILASNPYLDEVVEWDRPKGKLPVRSLLQTAERLREREFDWAIDFQGNLRSALISRASAAKRVVGNRGAKERADLFYHVRVPRNTEDFSSRQRCLDLLRPLGIESGDRRMVLELAEGERRAGAAVLRDLGIAPAERYACLVPATTWAQKHWFEESWAALARELPQRLGLTPMLLGGPGDAAMADRIRAAGGERCRSAAGRTSLRQAAAILEGAALTVAVDTAMLHMSVALGTPTVGLAGASWWKGFRDYEGFALLREEMPCSPCLHRPTCGGRFDCMRALTPEQVVLAARGLLAGAGQAGGPLAVLA